MSSTPRRSYTGSEKIAILREALLEGVSVSDVCQKHGISPGMFYEWQKKLFEQSLPVLRSGCSSPVASHLASRTTRLPSTARRNIDVKRTFTSQA
ncbi:MAG: transposase [Phycisphaerae bacterium]